MSNFAFRLPDRLLRLIEARVWSTVSSNSLLYQPKLDIDNIKRLCPHEKQVFLYSPPFRDFQSDFNAPYWSSFDSAGFISPEKLMLIGDFGLGSDSPIAIKYDDEHPGQVFYLFWNRGVVKWALLSKSFDEFCDVLGI